MVEKNNKWMSLMFYHDQRTPYISLRMAALKLNVSPSTFSRLIKGEADLSPEMALRLSKAFGRTPESWMQMQSNYELWKARQHVNLEKVSVIYAHH
jgi:addiction module HigA family antidote